MVPYKELTYRSKLNPSIVLVLTVLPIVLFYLLLRVDTGVWWKVSLSGIFSFSISYASLLILYLGKINYLAGLQAACIRSAESEMYNGEPVLSCQKIKNHPLISIRKKLIEVQDKNNGYRGRKPNPNPKGCFSQYLLEKKMADVEYPQEKDPFWGIDGINPISYLRPKPLMLLPLTYYYWLLFKGQGDPLGVEPTYTLEHLLKHPTKE